ncbi:hypothetical protein CVS40_12775 [Lucilia cuprina]|nr:hypothetical protein CVS40_12775 [Lucilia cuprina]
MSSVWKYFTKNDNKSQTARCTKCPKILSCRGSSTSGLINHLRNVHKIELPSKSADKEGPSSSNVEKIPFTKLPVKKNNDIAEILARCVSEDGMSVRAVKNSKIIIDYLKMKGLKMPESENTIWSLIEQFYKTKKLEAIDNFKLIKEQNGRFSIIVDEWSDNSNIKYINVSLRSYNPTKRTHEVFNLGLEEIKIRGTAVNIEYLVKQKLDEFNLSLEADVVASTHDGAAVMKKYGTNILPESQLCMNHAIHLCVVDVIYSKKDSTEEIDDSEEEMLEDDGNKNSEEEFEIGIDIDASLNVCSEVGDVVAKLRKYVKIFNKSNEKQKRLQYFVKNQDGKELKLISDVKHRWNSLSKMIENFLRIWKCVNHALLDFSLIPFSSIEIEALENLWKTLQPLEIAIKELSKDSVTLIEGEAINKFLFNNLSKINTQYAQELCNRLMIRLNERRIKVVNTLIVYLSSGKHPANDHILKYSTKAESKEFAVELYNRLFPCSEPGEELVDSDVDLSFEIDNSTSLISDLNSTISSIQNPKKTRKQQSSLYDDFIYLDKCNKRTEKLEILYNCLLTICPTSTFSERVFSTSSFIKNKQKNRLKAHHLNCILFLKYYFRTN